MRKAEHRAQCRILGRPRSGCGLMQADDDDVSTYLLSYLSSTRNIRIGIIQSPD